MEALRAVSFSRPFLVVGANLRLPPLSAFSHNERTNHHDQSPRRDRACSVLLPCTITLAYSSPWSPPAWVFPFLRKSRSSRAASWWETTRTSCAGGSCCRSALLAS